MKITVSFHRLATIFLSGCLLLPTSLWAQSALDDSPSAGAMVGDLVVARPVGIVLTVVGTAAFIVSLPFTLLAGNAGEAAETLMIGPAETTFMRCLGCSEPGYVGKDRVKSDAESED